MQKLLHSVEYQKGVSWWRGVLSSLLLQTLPSKTLSSNQERGEIQDLPFPFQKSAFSHWNVGWIGREEEVEEESRVLRFLDGPRKRGGEEERPPDWLDWLAKDEGERDGRKKKEDSLNLHGSKGTKKEENFLGREIGKENCLCYVSHFFKKNAKRKKLQIDLKRWLDGRCHCWMLMKDFREKKLFFCGVRHEKVVSSNSG